MKGLQIDIWIQFMEYLTDLLEELLLGFKQGLVDFLDRGLQVAFSCHFLIDHWKLLLGFFIIGIFEDVISSNGVLVTSYSIVDFS